MSFFFILKTSKVNISDQVISFFPSNEDLRRPITSNEELRKRLDETGYFLLSGGGSYIFNNRYLLTVKREATNQINPSFLSLFTGRSDSFEEILNPVRLARELFEEVLIFNRNGELYIPKNKDFQVIIDGVYKDHCVYKKNKHKSLDVNIEYLDIGNKLISTPSCSTKCFAHINERREINVLFCFNIKVDNPFDLAFVDTEYFNNNNLREIFLFDLKTNKIFQTDKRDNKLFNNLKMTSHLTYLIEKLEGAKIWQK